MLESFRCSSLCGATAAAVATPPSEPSPHHVHSTHSATAGRDVSVMDTSPPSYLSTGCSGGRYAGVARYLASLEMAGGDLEAPPGHLDNHDDDHGAPLQAAGDAKPGDGEDIAQASSAPRRHCQVVNLFT